jgi:6-phosphogluconolactonase
LRVLRYASAAQAAEDAARHVADCAARAMAKRGQFTLALSGGSTPWAMLAILADMGLDWSATHLFQVDERRAPDGDAARNLTHTRSHFTDRIDLAESRMHAMPVTTNEFETGAQEYAVTLRRVCGLPAVLDLVHLGMGSDGHTASLLPGDDLLEVADADVGVTGVYQGHRRMSLTFPAINRARHIMWLVNGADKSDMLQRMVNADRGIPAGRIEQARATVFTDIPGA